MLSSLIDVKLLPSQRNCERWALSFLIISKEIIPGPRESQSQVVKLEKGWEKIYTLKGKKKKKEFTIKKINFNFFTVLCFCCIENESAIYVCVSIYLSISGEGNGTPLQYSCLENPMDGGAWQAAVHGVAKSRTRLSDFTFTFHFPALEKEMETHSSVLAWRIPGTGEPGGLRFMGSHRVGHD